MKRFMLVSLFSVLAQEALAHEVVVRVIEARCQSGAPVVSNPNIEKGHEMVLDARDVPAPTNKGEPVVLRTFMMDDGYNRLQMPCPPRDYLELVVVQVEV